MMGTIIIGTVADDHRHVIGMMVCHHKVIRTGFGSGVRRTRVISRFFCEKAFSAQGAVYFIGRHVVEQLALHISLPVFTAGVQQDGGAQYVGLDKGQRIHDRTVYMAFCCQVYHPVKLVSGKELVYKSFVCYITFLKNVIWLVLYRSEEPRV